LRKFGKQIDQGLIGFASFGREARDDVAEIVFIELGIFCDLAGEEAFAERAEGNEADAEFLEGGDDFSFGLSPPQGVLALERGDG